MNQTLQFDQVTSDPAVIPSSARLWFDGVSVAADITPTADGILLTYTPGLLQGQSQHTVRVEFTDDAPTPNIVTKSWVYTTAGYAQIPPALGTAVGTGADPGLKWRTHQLESGSTTSIDAAEQQLAGALGASVHLAEDFFSGGSWVGPQAADGYFAMNYINSELDATPAGNFNITALPPQNVEDEHVPGINTQLRPVSRQTHAPLAVPPFVCLHSFANSREFPRQMPMHARDNGLLPHSPVGKGMEAKE
jgi:hypothetical protein